MTSRAANNDMKMRAEGGEVGARGLRRLCFLPSSPFFSPPPPPPKKKKKKKKTSKFKIQNSIYPHANPIPSPSPHFRLAFPISTFFKHQVLMILFELYAQTTILIFFLFLTRKGRKERKKKLHQLNFFYLKKKKQFSLSSFPPTTTHVQAACARKNKTQQKHDETLNHQHLY